MATSLSVDVLTRLRAAYSGAADPERAAGMRAYMRDLFAFHGIAMTERRRLDRAVLAGLPAPSSSDDLREVALGCWALAEREYQYFACDYLRRFARVATPEFVPTLEQLIVTKSWWDTVDALAAHAAGPLVARHPSLVSTMDGWLAADNLWLIRTALLHQLTYKEKTDTDRLFAYCDARLDHPDFFIRKAIGWCLRQYAHVDPVAVRDYVAARADRISTLSRREALKNVGLHLD